MRLFPIALFSVACMSPEPDTVTDIERAQWIDNGFASRLILVQHKDLDAHTVHYNGRDLVTRQFSTR